MLCFCKKKVNLHVMNFPALEAGEAFFVSFFTTMFQPLELQERINTVKRYLNREINHCKASNATTVELSDLGTQIDAIHEIERIGVRNLQDVHFRKISRILTNVEVRMNLPKN